MNNFSDDKLYGEYALRLAVKITMLTLLLAGVAGAETQTATKRHITFSGYDWVVKSSVIPVGPGPNYFSDSTESVWVDALGQLHLKIINLGGTWHSAEVISASSFGYGKYVFHTASRLDKLDKNAVAGFFTWDDLAPEYYYREKDIEASRWGEIENDNFQYVVQPWDHPGNRYRFNMNLTGNNSIQSFDWKPDSVVFKSIVGSDVIGSWTYTGSNNSPPGKENVRINLWLYDGDSILGKPPSDGSEAEIIIKKFEFVSSIQKGDLNGNGIPADPGDLVLMKQASISIIEADLSYDLNSNGIPADPGDIVLMKQAMIGEIKL